ncbi:glycosyltransferase family 2 protein [Geobacter sp. SVR]|uniref:glycosyltransferase family 2 protein n=1 Tax=Geobacter sp. SVR TaxID=2495594 RepID=UPI00143EFE95|nr:glycosyltransferase family 2 protein [Geobacter sp. SVR]BCS54305.1 glycosyl transferase family 2 [Geobacter sp. SVR]GCF85836.1 glycosyl transferase family 2 [Geobacter sp. SVR]
MATCILIPAFNAEKSVAEVTRECQELGLPVVVVDDGSTDATARIVAGLPVTLLSHDRNRGKGRALMTGFTWALEKGYEAVVTVDADGQHDVSAIPRLALAARESGTDVLIASRFRQFEEMAGLRKVWNRFGVWCMRKRTGFEITDSQSGFRCYSSRLLRSVSLSAEGYDLEMELLMKAWRSGFTVASLPVAARVADGRATSHFRPVRDTWSICKVFLRHM